MMSKVIKSKEGFPIHFLEWKPNRQSSELPVICIHGNLSNARMYKWIGEVLSSEQINKPRHIVAIDIRGCGDSGLPDEGFTLDHMASDIEEVLNYLNISKAHFIAYSRGVAYALQYSLRNPQSVQGLVIGDFPPYYTKLNREWAERIVDSYKMYNGWEQLYVAIGTANHLSREQFEEVKDIYYVERDGIIQKRFAMEFPIRLQQESKDYDLTAALTYIHGKLLIFKGLEEGSLLSEEQIMHYEQYNPHIVRVNQAGHDVFEPRKQVVDALIHFFNHVN